VRHSFISTPTVGAFSRCCNNSHPDHRFHVCRTTWCLWKYLRRSAEKQAESRNFQHRIRAQPSLVAYRRCTIAPFLFPWWMRVRDWDALSRVRSEAPVQPDFLMRLLPSRTNVFNFPHEICKRIIPKGHRIGKAVSRASERLLKYVYPKAIPLRGSSCEHRRSCQRVFAAQPHSSSASRLTAALFDFQLKPRPRA
jgi:hypothetical protein